MTTTTQFSPITLSRTHDGTGRIGPCVRGTLAGWPVNAAAAIVAAVAAWRNAGFDLDPNAVRVIDDTDDGQGAVTVMVEPTWDVDRSGQPAVAGPEWDTALAAVLAAQGVR